MDSPRQFIYGPQWRILFCFFVVGVALLALAGVRVISLAVGFGLALLPLAFAFAGTLRRLAFPRFLELGQNGLSFCSGFLQTRVTTIPYRAQFVMLENGSPVCTIRLRSLLRNKYTLAFVNGQNWVFRMPLFTVIFGGRSDLGNEVRVRLWSHNIWYALIDPSADNPQLVAALAFVHRERLRFN